MLMLIAGILGALDSVNFPDLLRIVTEQCEEYGSPYKFWLGSRLLVVITKPEDIQIILNSSKTLDKGDVYKIFEPVVGAGLVIAPVEKWKKTRKILTPSFSPKNITRFVPIMRERATIILQEMQQHCGSGVEVDFYPYFFTASFDTLCGELLILRKMTPLVMERLFAPWLLVDYIYEKTSNAKKMKKDCDDFREFSKNASIQLHTL
ncbi:cytochrome P450 4C1-like [Bemisia tabaci]|uniref:cytochrome P450 4C1-like n=1 Tax=Bemisia tabaci TaxID=7038 RepID=UPI003B28B39C